MVWSDTVLVGGVWLQQGGAEGDNVLVQVWAGVPVSHAVLTRQMGGAMQT